jgi:hypothetical protein
MSGIWSCSGIVKQAVGLCNVWGLTLTEGLRAGGGDADHASSLSHDIRYEKPVFLISSRFRPRPQAKCVMRGLTQVLSKLPHFGFLRVSQLLSQNSWVTALTSSVTTRRHTPTRQLFASLCHGYNWRFARTSPDGLVLYSTCVIPVMSGVTQVLRHWRLSGYMHILLLYKSH